MSKLKEGVKAPDFSLPAQDGKKYGLEDFKGKTLVLYFYPKDLTPGCTIESRDFQKHLEQFKKKGVVVVGVSRDTVSCHKKFATAIRGKFPLLSDEDGAMCQAYGVWQKKKFMGREYMGIARTTFVIDPQGTVQKIFPDVKVSGHAETVLAEVDA